MSIKAVLFDLDGTLLPMDQDTFIKAYLGGMAKKLAPHGYNPDELVKAVYAGMKAMTTNDGSNTNEDAFWNAFTAFLVLVPNAPSAVPQLNPVPLRFICKYLTSVPLEPFFKVGYEAADAVVPNNDVNTIIIVKINVNLLIFIMFLL